ncbi:hypothetical protein F5Y04DRAFT_279175 [Hypomontagnella monticulosa]|nr:hypothetical protein F5Y04DRAFT_279175 [Hypomontagnella monticulosa]
MPTKRLRRAFRRLDLDPKAPTPPIAEGASLIDLLTALQHYDVSFLPVAYQKGREILGQGLSGRVHQASADVGTIFAFKQGVPSKQECDDELSQDWHSLVTEIAVLQHPRIRENHHVADLLGVAFSIEPGPGLARTTWPLLVSRRMALGDLGGLLTGEHQDLLTPPVRSMLLAEVVEAVYVLHACGVAHGDIKPSNFLVDKQDDELNCLIIDFGSCVIRGQRRLPTLSPPWNAPELQPGSNDLEFYELSDMDLFSLGLVCVHIILPLEDLQDAGLCFLRQRNQPDSEWAEAMQKFERVKQAGTADESLGSLLISVIHKAQIAADLKETLVSIVRGTIIAPKGSRSMPWDALKLTSAVDSDRFKHDFYEAIDPPPLSYNTSLQDHEKHVTFDLNALIGELDDTDYVVRQSIMRDLKSKADTCKCMKCRKSYALQVAVCYELGFGCVADEAAKSQWLEKSNASQIDVDKVLRQIRESYQGTNWVSPRVLEELGIGVLQTADRPLEYESSGRLKEAEASLKSEIEARSHHFGVHHISLARHERELAQVLSLQNRDGEAAEFQQQAAEILGQQYGNEHPSAVMARLSLAAIWAGQGLLQKAEDVQIRDIPLLRKLMGPANPDVLAAMGQQAHARATSGDHGEAEKILREVISQRMDILGPEHPLTVNSRLSLVTVLRAQGHLTEALEQMEIIEEHVMPVVEGDWLRTADIRMCQAQLYANMGHLDKAIASSKAACNAVKRLKVGNQNDLSVQERQVRASVHRARRERKEEECLLRQIIADLGSETIKASNSKSQLAWNLLWQGRNTDAVVVAEETIKSLGHSPLEVAPDVYIHCTGALVEDMLNGRRDLAEERLIQLFQLCTTTYGDDHPVTVHSAQSLAEFWNLQHQLDKTQDLLEPILARLRHRPGKSAIHIAGELAKTYRERGFGDRAVRLCEEALQWAVEIGGENHIDAVALRHTLARCFLETRRLSDAEELLGLVATQCSRVELTIEVKLSFYRLKRLQGKEIEALEYAQEAKKLDDTRPMPGDSLSLRVDDYLIQARTNVEGWNASIERDMLENIRARGEILGIRHPSRISMMANLAYGYGQTGRLHDAEQLFNEIEQLGSLDENTQPSEYATLLAKMADVSFRRGELEKAAGLERRALAIRQRIYSAEDNVVLVTKSNLASTLTELGMYAEAETHLRDVLVARERNVMADAQSIQRVIKAKKDLAGVLYFQKKLDESTTFFSGALQLARSVGIPGAVISDLEMSLQKVASAQIANSQPTA